MRLTQALYLLVFLFINGCDAPPKAPSQYEALLGYLFEHMEDETDEALVLGLGLENLYDWLEVPTNFSSASNGTQIRNLADEAVDALDEQSRNSAGLRGISTVTKSSLAPELIAGTLTWSGLAEVLEVNFTVFERDFEQDSGCFVDRNCTWVAASSQTVSKWVNIIEMDTRYRIQYRWFYSVWLGDVASVLAA